MKRILKNTLVLVLALSMILDMATTVFASDILGNQPTEETVAEQIETVAEPEGKYVGISSEIMAVIEDLDSQDYVEGELLVIYDDAESAEFAVSSMCANGEEASQSCGDDTVKVTFDENEISMEDKIIELSKEENVKYVQPNYIYSLIEGVDYYGAYEKMSELMTAQMPTLVNDSVGFTQFYLAQIHIGEAWSIVNKYGTSKVKVAVIDTGALTSHEDLANLNKDLCVDVTTGATTYPKQTQDDHGHGTHVSGIIGATANNNKGIAGGATLGKTDPSSRLELFTIDAFVRWYSGGWKWGAKSEDVKKALIYATDKGAKVINMSLGKIETSTDWKDDVMKQGIDYAYDHGAICVCAAGNDYTNSSKVSTYPSDYNKVISVIALDTIFYDEENDSIGQYPNDFFSRAYFSNFGYAQDISAPGVNIVSTYPSSTYSDYYLMDGTSQATPIVSSVIAMMFMMNPNLTFNQVYSIITSTATDMVYEFVSVEIDPVQGEIYYDEIATVGFDIYTAYGLINAEACVLALAPEVFTDIHKADWFYSSVSDMYYRGIMTGMGGTSNFGPGEKLQREQLATILYRLEGSPSPITYQAKFKDVPAGTWFTDPIIWAYQNGIITGYTTGYFGVGDPITREQFATMLYRYANNTFSGSYAYYGYADLSTYPDAVLVSDWAEEAMEWAVGAGIITGKQGGVYLDPGGNAQRCEAATMIQRFQYKFQF